MKPSASRYSHAQAHQDIEFLADGRLSTENQTRLHLHLTSCPECRTYQQEFLTLEKSLGELFQTHLPQAEYTSAENHIFTADVKTTAHALRPLLQIPQWFNSLAWGAALTLLMTGMAWVLANTRLDNLPDPTLSLALSLNDAPGTYFTFRGDSIAHQVAFSPDGKLLAAAYDNGEVIIWETTTQTTYLTLNADPQGVSSLTFAPNGLLLTLGKDNATLKVWQTDGQLLQTLTGISGNPQRVSISATGEIQFLRRPNELLFTTTKSPWITPRGANNTPILLPTLAGEVVATTLSPDGNFLVTGSTNGNIYFWQISHNNGQRLGVPIRVLKGHTGPITTLAFHPGGAWLVSTSSDGTILVWRVADGKQLYTLLDTPHRPLSIAFTANGSALATALEDGTVYLWLAEE